MKKIFMIFILSFFTCMPTFAQDEPEIIIYEAKGKTYFITGQLLEQLKADAKNTCLDGVMAEDKETNKSKYTKFYELLLSQCRQKIATLSGELKEKGTLMDKTEAYASNVMSRLSILGLIPAKIEYEYKGCLIAQKELQRRLKKLSSDDATKYQYTMSADIDTCIKNIEIHSDTSTCPIKTSVDNESVIANMLNMNTEYRNKTITFSEKPNIKSGQVLVFNGQVLVVCDNGNPVSIIKPTFSGYVACRDAEFQAYPNVGSTPDGIYLAKKEKIEEPEDLKSWGGYRIPLLPAHQTQTYGRENMYFHGTSDENKRRSGGCISLGVAIDDFIEGDWFQNQANDLLIIVDTH